jgi:hypothetical protein
VNTAAAKAAFAARAAADTEVRAETVDRVVTIAIVSLKRVMVRR